MESNGSKSDEAETIPEDLFHTTLTVINYHDDPTGANRSFFVLGTNSTLDTAKQFAAGALEQLHYTPDEFEEYEVRSPSTAETWAHGDGVVVFARAPAGQQIFVGIDTTPNNEHLAAGPGGRLILPTGGSQILHYVVQTVVDYNMDPSGLAQTTEIEGCYLSRANAKEAARHCLTAADFAENDIRDSAEMRGQWPFGEEVIVHAVASTGQNYYVAVKTDPWAKVRQHGKKWRGLW